MNIEKITVATNESDAQILELWETVLETVEEFLLTADKKPEDYRQIIKDISQAANQLTQNISWLESLFYGLLTISPRRDTSELLKISRNIPAYVRSRALKILLSWMRPHTQTPEVCLGEAGINYIAFEFTLESEEANFYLTIETSPDDDVKLDHVWMGLLDKIQDHWTTCGGFGLNNFLMEIDVAFDILDNKHLDRQGQKNFLKVVKERYSQHENVNVPVFI